MKKKRHSSPVARLCAGCLAAASLATANAEVTVTVEDNPTGGTFDYHGLIRTDGTLLDAINLGHAGADITVNGVTFVSTPGPNPSGTNWTGVSPNVDDGLGNAGIDDLFFSEIWGTAPGTVTYNNLNAGNKYLVQILHGEPRNCCTGTFATNTISHDGGGTNPVPVPTFTIGNGVNGENPPAEADIAIITAEITGATTFTYTMNDGSGRGQSIAGFQVRDLGSVSNLNLAVTSSGADLVFTWNSQIGKVYDLLSSIDPEADGNPGTWSPVAGQEDMAADPGGTNMLTIARPADDKRLYVVREEDAPPLFFDDFETDKSWSVGANGGDGSNTIWERGAPVSSLPGGARGPDTGANGSTNCFGTNVTAIYGPNTDIYLRSPEISIPSSGVTEATLTMQQFLDVEVPAPSNDVGTIRVLRANDLSELGVVQTNIEGFSADWEPYEATLPGAVLGETVVLEFQFTSDGVINTDFGGWYIDDVSVDVK